MRILFSGSPAYGHLFPLLPLARAAHRAGHQAAFLTSPGMRPDLAPFRVLAAGPPIADLGTEYARRHPPPPGDGNTAVRPEDADGSLGGWVDFFAGLRVDRTLPEALDRVGRQRPDLIVAETMDWVGPLVATHYRIPWAVHGFGRRLPGDLLARMARTALTRLPGADAIDPRIASLDPWPDILHGPGASHPGDRIVIRPQPQRGGFTGRPPDFGPRSEKETVLVTFGTVAVAPAALTAVLEALTDLDVNLIVTNPPFDLQAAGHDPQRVRATGDVALTDLLERVSVVLSAGGAGTILQSLARSLPMVFLPLVHDQGQHADAVVRTGAAVRLRAPGDAAREVRNVLSNSIFRRSADRVAQHLAGLPPPGTALQQLLGRMP